MPRVLEAAAAVSEPAPNRVLWTWQQCDAMRDAGILTERYELIEGEILSKMGQNRPHALTIVLLIKWLIAVFGADYVQCQLPIRLVRPGNSLNEPEPDAAVLRRPATDFVLETPTSAETLLIVEVSDSSLGFDRSTKARLYAQAGVPEYWILDIVGRQIFAHRQPEEQGYGAVVVYDADETIAVLSHPSSAVRVADLLPPI